MLLVSCGSDLKIHEYPSYELVNIYKPADSSGPVKSISWCKDGTWLVLVPFRGVAEIIRTNPELRLLQSILGVPQPTSAAFQRTTKKYVAMSTMNGGIIVYDIKSRNIKKKFPKSHSQHTMLDWSLKDTHLAAAGSNETQGTICLYSNTTNQKSCEFTIPSSKSVSVIKFHPTQRPLLGCASDEGVVTVWDINTGKTKFCLQPHQCPVTGVAFSSQNQNLMTSVSLDRKFQCFDTSSGQVALSVLTEHPLSSIDMAPDGQVIAVGSTRGTIFVYDLRRHQEPVNKLVTHNGEVKQVLYQPICSGSSESINLTDQKVVVTTSEGNSHRSVSVDSLVQFSDLSEFSPQVGSSKKRPSEVEDSFFAENSSLKEKSNLSNLGITEGVKKWAETKYVLDGSTQNKEKNSDVQPVPAIKPASSTPRMNRVSFVQNQENLCPGVSPIVGNVPLSTDDLKKVVKEAVSEAMTDFVQEIRYNTRKQFLDLLMCFTKQFVKLGEDIETLAESRNNECTHTHLTAQLEQLQAENEFLKSKINELYNNKSL